MKVLSSASCWLIVVDYIVVIIADVEVNVNSNEVRDTRYVSPERLREMFRHPGRVPQLWGSFDRF